MRDGVGSVQSVLLLGGTSEIGLAIVQALVKDRARTVILAGRDASGMERAAEDLRGRGATRVDVLALEATSTEEHSAVINEAFTGAGDIDAVVMALGILGDDERARREPQATVELLHTNLVAPASLLVAVSKHLQHQGHGTLVVLSSVAGERVRSSNFVYGSSKAGLDAFAQGLGDSLSGTGVDVLVVRPGFVRTKMTAGLKAAPLSTTADRVAGGAVNGIRRRAHTIWTPAPLRWVMLALRLLPRALFRRLPI